MIEPVESEFPESYWNSTPSRKDGMSPEQELELRQKVCRFILTIVDSLELEEDISEIAAYRYVHEYYNRKSFATKAVDKYDLGLAALFLSLKVNDNVRTLNELVLAQWRYLSPTVPVPTYISKSLKSRIECIERVEMHLISTINFKLNYTSHTVHSDRVAEHFFPHLLKSDSEESKKLFKHYYYLSYHSFWTHADLFFSPVAVAAAALRLAARDLNSAFGFGLPFDTSKFPGCGVDPLEVQKVCEILEFGALRIPGEKGQHDRIQPIDMEKFRPRDYPRASEIPPSDDYIDDAEIPPGTQSQTGNSAYKRVKLAYEGNPIIRIYEIPLNFKHHTALRKFFKEEVAWSNFYLRDDHKVDLILLFRHRRSVECLFRYGAFSDEKDNYFNAKFESKTCKAMMGENEDVGMVGLKSDEAASLHVANIDAATDEQALLEAFAPFGEIVSVKIPHCGDTSRYRFYGFVNFKFTEAKTKALKAKIKLSGKILDVTARETSEAERNTSLRHGVMLDGPSLAAVDEFEILGALRARGKITALAVFKTAKNSLGIRDVAFAFFEGREDVEKLLTEQKTIKLSSGEAKVGAQRFSADLIQRSGTYFPVLVRGVPRGGSILDLRQSLAKCGDLAKSKLLYGSFDPRTKSMSGIVLFRSRESQKLAMEMKNLFVRKCRVRVTLP